MYGVCVIYGACSVCMGVKFVWSVVCVCGLWGLCVCLCLCVVWVWICVLCLGIHFAEGDTYLCGREEVKRGHSE